jgi:putative intracellular protease/amidase
LTIASPKGGEAPLDPSSVEMFKDDTSVNFLNTQKALWTKTEKLSDMLPRANEFDAIFYVGGHGRTSQTPSPTPNNGLKMN